ncbi:MAG: GNAT family N-acetyltransferase [Dehalococcoidia bacterium]
MPDMLVKLYDLPDASPEVAALRERGISCRRAEAYERSAVLAFARSHFPHWADEVAVGFGSVPPAVYIAVEKGAVLGFACYNVTRPNFFGPTGVDQARRKEGIGRVLLLQCLDALKAEGYAYAIIGGVGPAEFYQKAVGGTLIPGSDPGIYRDRIHSEPRSSE